LEKNENIISNNSNESPLNTTNKSFFEVIWEKAHPEEVKKA